MKQTLMFPMKRQFETNPNLYQSKKSIKMRLKLTVSTWEKQSHGLFDYQSAP